MVIALVVISTAIALVVELQLLWLSLFVVISTATAIAIVVELQLL